MRSTLPYITDIRPLQPRFYPLPIDIYKDTILIHNKKGNHNAKGDIMLVTIEVPDSYNSLSAERQNELKSFFGRQVAKISLAESLKSYRGGSINRSEEETWRTIDDERQAVWEQRNG